MATFSVRGVRLGAPAPAALRSRSARAPRSAGVRPARASASADVDSETGLVKARKGIKVAAEENVLTPRFYTTDFEEMDRLWAGEWNSRLNQEEMACMLAEFRYDYNQKHFVRNDSFRKAAESIRGPARKIFIEFLERSCTAEFSGFLLYKELGRRMKASNPVVAEIFTLMSRDEARHAGFLNKAMSGASHVRVAGAARTALATAPNALRRGTRPSCVAWRARRRCERRGCGGARAPRGAISPCSLSLSSRLRPPLPRLRPGAGPGLPDQEPHVHLLQAQVHPVRHLSV
jgi:hypothetical protein